MGASQFVEPPAANRGKRVIVVRPYYDSIRQRVFSLLEKASLKVDPDDIFPPGLDDDQIILLLSHQRRAGELVLLIPFNARKDPSGKAHSGLDLMFRILKECPNLASAVLLMPVSQIGRIALDLGLQQASANPSTQNVLEVFKRRVLVLPESEFGKQETVQRLIRRVYRGE